MPRKHNPEISDYILDNITKHPADITALAAERFHLSRAAANAYMRRLINEGVVEASGNTKARRYSTKPLVEQVFIIQLSAALEEDVVWRYKILPLMKNVPANVVDICQYCFTEILNNAIDHSASADAVIAYTQTHHKLSMAITDHGVGIFEKIQRDFRLSDPRAALLELAKGKLTSDKKNHSGQGIFFTSRMLDEFYIRSGYLFYSRERQEDDEWLIETEDKSQFEIGTWVLMEIHLKTDRTAREVFDKYQGRNLSFRKTHVPIKLSKYPGEQLVSRSQAKRVLARVENFTEVILDFKDVHDIGHSFADEIFRVYKNAHPDIKIIAVHTTPEIDKTIKFV